MPFKDPAERRAHHRNYIRKRMKEPDYRAKQMARIRRFDKANEDVVRGYISAFRAGGCATCPEQDPACLSAHHIEPERKDFNIGAAVKSKYGAKRVQAELAKCVCLCHNCHAKFHAGLLTLPA